MDKERLNKASTKSTTIKCTIAEEQEKIIEDLIGILGTNKQDVAGKIITLWLYKEGYLQLNKKEKKNEKK